jgi:hypothetical protein
LKSPSAIVRPALPALGGPPLVPIQSLHWTSIGNGVTELRIRVPSLWPTAVVAGLFFVAAVVSCTVHLSGIIGVPTELRVYGMRDAVLMAAV